MTLPPYLFPEAISPKQIIFMLMTAGYFAVALPLALKYKWMDRFCVAVIFYMSTAPIDLTLFSYTNYRGDIRGIEFGVIDWMYLTLLFAMHKAPRWKKHKFYTDAPTRIPMFLFLAYSTCSIFFAFIPQFAFFGVEKIIRVYTIFFVFYNYVRSEDDLKFLLYCIIGTTLYNFSQVLMDKYVRGVFPPRGSFPHQNSLGAFQNLLNFIIFAFLMGGKEKLFSKENLLMWVAFGAGSLTSLATLSRATMTTMILGYILTIGMSLYLKQKKSKKKKKLKSIGIIIMMTLPGLAVLLPPIIHRFETAPKESGESRIEANRQSAHMAHDHPLGVGINNYSFAINSLELPYARHLKPLDRGITHNIYYLTYAELGWIGLILHLTIIFTFMYVGIRFILRRRDSPERNFAIGALTAVLINALHQNLEWVVFREFAILTVYFIIVGTLCSMDRVEKERIRSEKREMMMQYYMLSMFMKRRRKRR